MTNSHKDTQTTKFLVVPHNFIWMGQATVASKLEVLTPNVLVVFLLCLDMCTCVPFLCLHCTSVFLGYNKLDQSHSKSHKTFWKLSFQNPPRGLANFSDMSVIYDRFKGDPPFCGQE